MPCPLPAQATVPPPSPPTATAAATSLTRALVMPTSRVDGEPINAQAAGGSQARCQTAAHLSPVLPDPCGRFRHGSVLAWLELAAFPEPIARAAQPGTCPRRCWR